MGFQGALGFPLWSLSPGNVSQDLEKHIHSPVGRISCLGRTETEEEIGPIGI